MTSLGEKLKQQNEARAAADRAIQDAKTAAQLEAAREAQRKVSVFFEKIKHDIEDRIEGNLPLKPWRLPEDRDFYIPWNPDNLNLPVNTFPGTFPHYSIAMAFVRWANENDLEVRIKGDHDGGGHDSWFNVVVTPK